MLGFMGKYLVTTLPNKEEEKKQSPAQVYAPHQTQLRDHSAFE